MSHISKGDLHAYLDGALGAYPEEAAKHVQEHLDTCPECAELLETERRLRQEASAIIAASAQGPVELDTLDELMARAKASGGRELAAEPTRPSRTGAARRSLGSRMYMLRWAATVVVSLGAGWMARDLSGPAGDVEREVLTTPFDTEIGLPSGGDQQRPELDGVDEPAEEETAGPQVTAPSELAETVDAPEPAAASGLGAGAGAADRSVGRLDADPTLDIDAGAALDQVEAVAARQREEAVAIPGVAPADVIAAAPPPEPQARAFSDELRAQAPTTDRRDAAAALGNAQALPSVGGSLSTTSFLVPGLPVRDVRLAPGAGGFSAGMGSSLVVTQELEDGRVVELRFAPMTTSDDVSGGALDEGNRFSGLTLPAGWAMAVREVEGGVAALSGPLTESELAELLDLALGLR